SYLFVGGTTFNRFAFNYVTGTFTTLNLLNSANAPAGPIYNAAIATNQGTYHTDPDFPLLPDLGANNPDASTIYASDGTDLFVTKDLGLTWNTISRTPPYDSTNTNISDIEVDPTNRDHVFVVTGGFFTGTGFVGAPNTGRVFETFNAGISWTDI